MASLYELTNEFLQVMSDLEDIADAEPTEATVELLAAIEADIRNKADGYASLIRHFQVMAKAAKEEWERLGKRVDAKERKAQWLKDRLKAAMEAIGETKIETPLNTIRISQNGGETPLTIQVRPDELPEQFRKVEYQPDRTAIRRALKEGQFVPGCQLMERGSHLRIT